MSCDCYEYEDCCKLSGGYGVQRVANWHRDNCLNNSETRKKSSVSAYAKLNLINFYVCKKEIRNDSARYRSHELCKKIQQEKHFFLIYTCILLCILCNYGYHQGFGAGQIWHGSGSVPGYNYKRALSPGFKQRLAPAPDPAECYDKLIIYNLMSLY